MRCCGDPPPPARRLETSTGSASWGDDGRHGRPRLQERLRVHTYDETIRFNIVLIDDRIGTVQPYLPEARGTDSPTLVLEPRRDDTGLFAVFAQVFESLWERSKPR